MILILDIGKTNKKCFVFDEDYRIVFEQSTQLPETTDEDGDPCEDIDLLSSWVLESVCAILNDPRFSILAINCTTYGASFVHVSRNAVPGLCRSSPERRSGVQAERHSEVRTPLYNYLKPFPEDLQKQFFDTYGEASKIALETASPILGNLNSGLQLYWLKHRRPLIFNQIEWSLHLPQYVSYLIDAAVNMRSDAAAFISEITSIGCHTLLWNFRKNDYHDWVKAEGIDAKFPPLVLRNAVSERIEIGPEPLVLRNAVSERTDIGPEPLVFRNAVPERIEIDPEPLVLRNAVPERIEIDPEQPVLRNAVPERTDIDPEQRSGIPIGPGLHDSSAALIPYLACFKEPFLLISTGTWCISLNPFNDEPLTPEELAQDCLCYLSYDGKPVKAARYFGGHEHEQAVIKLAEEYGVNPDFYQSKLSESAELSECYNSFMRQLIGRQLHSTRLALGKTPVRHIFVDGGFSKNELYMKLLAQSFPKIKVYAAEVAQATALGAALSVHTAWNEKPVPQNLITLNQIRV